MSDEAAAPSIKPLEHASKNQAKKHKVNKIWKKIGEFEHFGGSGVMKKLMNRAKLVYQLFDMYLVEHYGKRKKILHGRPFDLVYPYHTLAKNEIIYRKNVRAKVTMDFT